MDLIYANGILVRALAILNVPAYTISDVNGDNRRSFAREARGLQSAGLQSGAHNPEGCEEEYCRRTPMTGVFRCAAG